MYTNINNKKISDFFVYALCTFLFFVVYRKDQMKKSSRLLYFVYCDDMWILFTLRNWLNIYTHKPNQQWFQKKKTFYIVRYLQKSCGECMRNFIKIKKPLTVDVIIISNLIILDDFPKKVIIFFISYTRKNFVIQSSTHHS